MVVLFVALVAVLVAIFVLAQQGVRRTGDVALAAERWLCSVVAPAGTGSIGEPTWWGLTIRRLAHIVEFGVLGLVAGVAAACLAALPASWVLAAGFCAVVSVADEVHKRFVPGRHFDARDLVLDAAGYVPATLMAAGLCALLSLP